MWMVQHRVCRALGHFLVKGRHQWGLAAAWLEEKPGLGSFRQIIVSLPYWSYSCWHLQAGLNAGTDEPQSSIVCRQSLFHQIQLIPDQLLNSLRQISPDLREGEENENLPGERVKHFCCFPFVRKCFKHRSWSWETTELILSYLINFLTDTLKAIATAWVKAPAKKQRRFPISAFLRSWKLL